jgi:hypothetical protein
VVSEEPLSGLLLTLLSLNGGQVLADGCQSSSTKKNQLALRAAQFLLGFFFVFFVFFVSSW